MVVFTCNNCGDSVTKPKVEKHIQYECKRKHFAVSFCCVDCLKDFNYETVKDHCQCVTEEQRYSAKGFVAKPSADKGKRKQAGWVDIVQSVINRKDLSNDEKQFLNVISKYDNVPRKKNKFQNFCFSSAPYYRQKEYLVNKVFDMIEAEYKAQQTHNSNEKPANTNNNQDQKSIENSETNDTILDKPQEVLKKNKIIENGESVVNEKDNNVTEIKLKKKKKKSKESLDAKNKETTPESNTELQTKKKKKKKMEENNSVIEGNLEIEKTNSTEVLLDTSIKSKKKKKTSEVNVSNDRNENSILKSENTKNLNGAINGDTINQNNNSQMSKKEKKEMKKKLKYQNELTSAAKNVVELDTKLISKKKKRKLNGNEENEEPQQKILKTDELSQVPEVQSGRKFDWNEAINQVLHSKKSKPMSICKVMKRVMNEYHFLNESSNKSESKLEKIFLKKLRKMKNVVIDNDKVQVLEC